MVSEEAVLRGTAFPADCLYRSDCHCRSGDRRVRAELPGFPAYGRIYLRNYNGQLIVTAAVHRGFDSELRPGKPGLTRPLNLPALGRRQPLYVALRLSRDLCFC